VSFLKRAFKPQPVKKVFDNPYVPCSGCGQNIHTTNDQVEIPLEKFHNRQWSKVGLECPHCTRFHFGYYNHDKIEKRRAKLKKIKDSEKLKREKERLKQYHLNVQQAGKILFG